VAPLREQALVPAAADDPLARPRLGDPGGDPVDDLRDRPAVVQLDVSEQGSGREQVVVRVDQPGEDDASVERLDPGPGRGEREGLAVSAREEDPVAADRERGRPSAGGVQGVDVASDEDEVGTRRELSPRDGQPPPSSSCGASAARQSGQRRSPAGRWRSGSSSVLPHQLANSSESSGGAAQPQPEHASSVSGVVMACSECTRRQELASR
jgi:hypothetical protein